MKWNYIATAAATVLLVGTGIYWFNTRPIESQPSDKPVAEEKIMEVIDGKEVVLEVPLTQSFSNAESNKQVEDTKRIKAAESKKYTNVQQIVKKVTKPLVIGMYYLNNIASNKCKLTGTKDSDSVKDEIRKDGDYELLAVSKQKDESFVFVSAESPSETTCLRLIQFNQITTDMINPIHILIN